MEKIFVKMEKFFVKMEKIFAKMEKFIARCWQGRSLDLVAFRRGHKERA